METYLIETYINISLNEIKRMFNTRMNDTDVCAHFKKEHQVLTYVSCRDNILETHEKFTFVVPISK